MKTLTSALTSRVRNLMTQRHQVGRKLQPCEEATHVGTPVESPPGQLSCHLSPGTRHVKEEPVPLFKTLSDILVSPGETSDTMGQR